MTEQLKDALWYDMTLFRVWPDGTVQEADQSAYPWMSDDHALVWAYDDDHALVWAYDDDHALVWAYDDDHALVWAYDEGLQVGAPKLHINWGGVALVAYVVFSMAALAWQAVLLINWVASKL